MDAGTSIVLIQFLLAGVPLIFLTVLLILKGSL